MANPKRLANLDPHIVAVLNEDSLNRRKAAGEAALGERSTFVELEAGGDSALVERLTCDSDMNGVWTELDRLAKESRDEFLPLDFLTLAVTLPRQWVRMSKVPTAVAREDLSEIGVLARKLARKLRANRAEIRMLVGHDTDLSSVIVTDLDARGKIEQAAQIKRWGSDAALNDEQPVISDYPEALEALADRLDVPDHQLPIGGRPTKPNDPNAARTYFVQQLAAFLQDRTDDRIDKKMRNQVIAGMVNAMVDNPNSWLTARHVELILKPDETPPSKQ